jgi:hypothetical protein
MNKIIITSFFLLASYATNATEASIGRIVEVHGSGFISKDGKTKEIRKGDQLYPNSEIVVEHSGQVTFTDNADHRYHMGNAASVALGPNSVELRTGDIWFQSLNKSENYQLKTANATVDYQGGEAILSYDISKGKTQLMVINGMMKISNIHTPELNLNVAEGNFSFVDLNYEAGAPRDPTPVGEGTYKQLIGMFHGIGPMDKHTAEVFTHSEVKREIASVHEVAHEEKKYPVNKDLAEYKKNFMFKKTTVHPKKVQSLNSAPLIVKIYGVKTSPEKTEVAVKAPEKVSASARMPASVKEEPVAEKAETAKTKEADKLIQALKNL